MKMLLFFCLPVLFVLTAAFMLRQPTKPWTIPDAAAKMANPVKTDAESISTGKSLWGQHCSSCHGKTGMGDGSKAAQLKTPLTDFTKATPVQSESDGAIFYQISEGRDEMPTFKKKIPDADDRWSLVNYIRTLKK